MTSTATEPNILPIGTKVRLLSAVEGKYTDKDGETQNMVMKCGQIATISNKHVKHVHTRVSTGEGTGKIESVAYALSVELPKQKWEIKIESVGAQSGQRIPHELLSMNPTSLQPRVVGTMRTDDYWIPLEMAYLRGNFTYNVGYNSPNGKKDLNLGDRIEISTPPGTIRTGGQVSQAVTERSLKEAGYLFKQTKVTYHTPQWVSGRYYHETEFEVVKGAQGR